jgi:hypothetical protein
VVTRTDMTLASVEETMKAPPGEDFGNDRVLAIQQTTGQFVADMSAKDP